MSQKMNVYRFFDDFGKSLDYVKVSIFFTIKEFREALFCLSSEKITQVPIPQNLLYAMDYLRQQFGKPIIINSHFRTLEYEKTQGRSGHSQHKIGKAVDLSGHGLVDFLANAVKNKTEVYKQLRKMGINAIGLYDNFVHIDVRDAKLTGGLYYWDERGNAEAKIKDDDNAPVDWSLFGVGFGLLGLLFKFLRYGKKRK